MSNTYPTGEAITYQHSHWNDMFRKPYDLLKSDENDLYEKLLHEDFLVDIKENIIQRRNPMNSMELVTILSDFYLANEEGLRAKAGKAYDKFKQKLQNQDIKWYIALACATMKDMQKKGYIPKTILTDRFPSVL